MIDFGELTHSNMDRFLVSTVARTLDDLPAWMNTVAEQMYPERHLKSVTVQQAGGAVYAPDFPSLSLLLSFFFFFVCLSL